MHPLKENTLTQTPSKTRFQSLSQPTIPPALKVNHRTTDRPNQNQYVHHDNPAKPGAATAQYRFCMPLSTPKGGFATLYQPVGPAHAR